MERKKKKKKKKKKKNVIPITIGRRKNTTGET
jgi:hypothetical protein